jgi:hydrogenase expression/formation protein HypE
VITPLFFPGGNIGKIAFCGTVNDLVVKGAEPLGLSLSLVIEEGFSKEELRTIVDTIAGLSKETSIPIVTGDTKVMERGSLDKIIINTSGVGLANPMIDDPLEEGDAIIVSGGIGEHGTALMARRFELETDIQSCTKPLHAEIKEIKNLIKQAKDITRGGIAAILNEISSKNNVEITIDEESVPLKKQVRALTEILGLEAYHLACEGRFVCACKKEKSQHVVEMLKKFNPLASIIGHVSAGKGVKLQTCYGKRVLQMPSGNIVPRIC